MEITSQQLNHPWFVAVWPGMGNVAVSAGYYLMAKLQMRPLAEFYSRELFDLDHIEVHQGLISIGNQPRNRIFVWSDPKQRHDIVLFIGEAQPPTGNYLFCRKLMDYANGLGVEKLFTFASMATEMHPEHEARVFGAATDKKTLHTLQNHHLNIIQGGQISGLNGTLLGAAKERGLSGACLLGEIPHIFSQLPFPKATMAILKVFTNMAHIDLDLSELAGHAQQMERELGGLLAQIEKKISQHRNQPPEEPWSIEPAVTIDEEQAPRINAQQKKHIERLFKQALDDRSKAYELKAFLDRLEVFDDYEDRFLDLFQKPDEDR
ncbi:MAG: PAC2 family protein [Verrucomicrobiae bacterium]|nr:PAC2 family protein [Verrucomicrobiae bacterium]NNJ43818.1 hypothetical protein [Akkermansiaceae bacterium]